MSKARVLDASAALACLQRERGGEAVEAALDQGPCWMTTVNVCEVLGKLCELGMPLEEARVTIDDLGVIVVDFDMELAALAASLRVQTKSIGASLGDRACLALAARAAHNATAEVYTSEQQWSKLKWPFKVIVIR